MRTTLEVGEGRHLLIITTPRSEERLDVVMETTWTERDGDLETVFVVNVLGAALLIDEDVCYGDEDHRLAPRVAHLLGEPFVSVPGVADPFTKPPASVSGAESKTRRGVRWHGEGQPADRLVRSAHEWAPRTAHELLALHRRLQPDDAALLELEKTLCGQGH